MDISCELAVKLGLLLLHRPLTIWSRRHCKGLVSRVGLSSKLEFESLEIKSSQKGRVKSDKARPTDLPQWLHSLPCLSIGKEWRGVEEFKRVIWWWLLLSASWLGDKIKLL
jgi:hypothetical protein